MNAMTVYQPPQFAVSDMERMAVAFANSRLFGVQNPEQALALCLVAQAEGRHPASAAQDYHIINGRPSKKADAMLRDFISGGGTVEWHNLDDTLADATFAHKAGGKVRITWDMERATKAGLATPMWKKYPRQMLRSRVVSEGVRTVYPMATSGMYVPEEVQEFEPVKEQPKQAAPAAEEHTEGEQFFVPRLTKNDASKALDKRLREGIAKCDTRAKLEKFLSQANVQDALASLPLDWEKALRDDEIADRFAAFDEADERAAIAGEIPDASDPTAQFDAMERENA